jgi:hypothetical protein
MASQHLSVMVKARMLKHIQAVLIERRAHLSDLRWVQWVCHRDMEQRSWGETIKWEAGWRSFLQPIIPHSVNTSRVLTPRKAARMGSGIVSIRRLTYSVRKPLRRNIPEYPMKQYPEIKIDSPSLL